MPRLRNFKKKGVLEAGCDEAGRGCLAGPVFAAAVILPLGFKHPLLDDSKKLSPKQREQLRVYIEEKALSWAVASVSPQEIDEINILKASFLAMHRAIEKLNPLPEHLLIDGNRFQTYPGIAHSCEIKGDGRFKNIAAASILAKTYRDAEMLRLSKSFPHYQWEKNKGYPTVAHREAIKTHGPSLHHRQSFRLLPDQLELPFEK